MKILRKMVFQYLLVATLAFIFMTGCQAVNTQRMYTGPDLPPDQLCTLVVPWCVRLRTVDGVPVRPNLKDELRLLLKPGTHVIEAGYAVHYPANSNGSDFEKITSKYIEVTLNGQAGKTYILCTKNPRTLEESRKYAANVSFWIEESAVDVVTDTAKSPAPAPAKSSAVENKTTDAVAAETAAGKSEILAQLLSMWEKAEEQDRKAFLDKIRKQQP